MFLYQLALVSYCKPRTPSIEALSPFADTFVLFAEILVPYVDIPVPFAGILVPSHSIVAGKVRSRIGLLIPHLPAVG